MLQRKEGKKKGDGSAGGTAGCEETITWKASEKHCQF